MSLEFTKNQILRFLKSYETQNIGPFGKSSGKVLALKGRWGIGKTYLWNQLVEEWKADASSNMDGYAYVSLFGCKSLNELKSLLFYQTRKINKETQEPKKKRFQKIENGVRSVSANPLIQAAVEAGKEYMGVSTDFGLLGWCSVKNILICIDDLERAGEGLAMKDVLGLVCELKDQRNCKVILIMHDGVIKDDYKEFREKVIDAEIRFEPTKEELFLNVFKDFDKEVSDDLLRFVSYFDIVNLRSYQKIKNHLSEIDPIVKKFEKEIKVSAIFSIVSLVAKYWDGIVKDKDADTTAQRTVLGVEYDLKKAFESYVADGWLNEDEIFLQLKLASEDLSSAKKRSDQYAQWRNIGEKYIFGSLEANELDFVDELKRHVNGSISLSRINEIVSLLREMGHDDVADECIDFYINEKKLNSKFESNILEDSNLSHRQFDSALHAKIQEEISEEERKNYKKRDVNEELEKIFHSKEIFSKDNVKFIATLEIKQLYDFLKQTKINRFVIGNLKQCMQGQTYSDLKSEHDLIVLKIGDVIRQLRSESKINALRLKWWGLDYLLAD